MCSLILEATVTAFSVALNRKLIEVGHWMVVFEGFFVKCKFFKERRDNGLLSGKTPRGEYLWYWWLDQGEHQGIPRWWCEEQVGEQVKVIRGAWQPTKSDKTEWYWLYRSTYTKWFTPSLKGVLSIFFPLPHIKQHTQINWKTIK